MKEKDINRWAAEMDEMMTVLETNAPFRVNIPADEKNDEQAMNVKRYPYVKNVIENYAPANVPLQPPFLSIADAANDFTLYNQFTPMIQRIMAILESYVDTQWLAGAEAYTYFRKFYALLQEAAKSNYPGADAILNDVKRLYEDQGGAPPGP